MGTTLFTDQGTSVILSPKAVGKVLDKLPVDTYTPVFNQLTGAYFLQRSEAMTMPGKIYGADITARRDRILSTFEKRDRSTGVMLTGEKGSGKTLMIKAIAVEAIARGIAVIKVETGMSGPAFNKLMADLQTPTIVVFDEFEKLYDSSTNEDSSGNKPSMEDLLTLLDGTVKCKHLFLFSTNSTSISTYMKNRPGRIYYIYEYDSLGMDVIEDYVTDNLKDKSKVPAFMMLARRFFQFNFDMMQALVEEINLYNEDPEVACQHLNIKLHFEEASYEVEVSIDGKALGYGEVSGTRYFSHNPFSRPDSRLYYSTKIYTHKTAKGEDEVTHGFNLDRESLTEIDKSGAAIFNFNLEHKELSEIFENNYIKNKKVVPQSMNVQFSVRRIARQGTIYDAV